MSNEHCKPGLDDRCRDQNGEIRHKRSDTLVGTLRKEYGEDFANPCLVRTRWDLKRSAKISHPATG
jgi:hypothetical protein